MDTADRACDPGLLNSRFVECEAGDVIRGMLGCARYAEGPVLLAGTELLALCFVRELMDV